MAFLVTAHEISGNNAHAFSLGVYWYTLRTLKAPDFSVAKCLPYLIHRKNANLSHELGLTQRLAECVLVFLGWWERSGEVLPLRANSGAL